MNELPIEFRFEEMIERIKTDPIIAVLALALNEVVERQETQRKINAVVHGILEKQATNNEMILNALGTLTEGMMALTASAQRAASAPPATVDFFPFKGIVIK